MRLTNLSTLFLALESTTLAAAAGSADNTPDCTLSDNGSGRYYDLRPLRRANGVYSVDGFDTGYSFDINVCSALSVSSGESAAQWQRSGERGLMGMANTKPFLRGKRLLLEYTDGDVCPSNSHLKQSTLISFICDNAVHGAGNPEFVAEWDQCAFLFEWRTPHACSVEHLESAPDSPQPLPAADDDDDNSRGDGGLLDGPDRNSVIFVAVFLVGSIYMLGGFLYNRVFNSSRGLRGLEQLPNYAMWHAIYVFFSTCFLTVFDVVTCRRGAVRRRGDISLDSEEYNIRTQLFDSDEDEDDAQPLSRRS